MGLQASLRQLAKLRIFAGLRVGGGCDQSAHVGLEFVGNDGIVLLIRHTENVFLRGGVELQRNGSVGSGAHIIVDQRSDGALQAAAAKGRGVGGVPDHGLHQRTAHLVRAALRRPETSVRPQHNDRVIRIEIDYRRPPCALEVLILHCVNNGKTAVDAALLAAPEG